jgi:hypothetical protein
VINKLTCLVWTFTASKSTHIYTTYRSTEEVVKYLTLVDPSAGLKAKNLYSCFERFHNDPLEYSLSVKLGLLEVKILFQIKGCQHEAAFVMHHLFKKQPGSIRDDQVRRIRKSC